MNFVHERLQSGRWVAPWLRYQNRARYEWACGFVRDREVIEVGCGGGHGTRMLAEAGASRVCGFDLSPKSIETARAHCDCGRLSFEVAEANRLPTADDQFDVAVSLETIEHVTDDHEFLREIVRVLKHDGLFLCSTPNRGVTNPGTSINDKPFNPHHVREYTQREFTGLLEPYFDSVQLLGQSLFRRTYVSLLNVIGRLAPRVAVRLHQCRKVAGIPFERLDKHRPGQIMPNYEPEVLVAVARLSAGSR